MKMNISKPRATTSEMDHTNVRRKIVQTADNASKHAMNPLDPAVQYYHTSTAFYPAGHPLRAYKDAKRAKKQSRVSRGS